MNDWKDKLRESHFNKAGGAGVKKRCKLCNEPLKDDKYDTCYKCSQESRKSGSGDSQGLPVEYVHKLEKGYFDPKGHIWEEFITTTASIVAKSFGTKLKTHQLRRFYEHAKAAENRLRMTGDWDAVNVDIKKLGPFVSEAKGKDKIPQSFYDFVDKNIKAIKLQKDFEKGFMEHFQAVVAYFTYHYPKS